MRRAVAILATAALAGGTLGAPASAQEDGVYLDDPEGPGGKEYSIPHERARREGAGPSGPGSRGETPRFGVGIEREGAQSNEGESGEGEPRGGVDADGSGGSGGGYGSGGGSGSAGGAGSDGGDRPGSTSSGGGFDSGSVDAAPEATTSSDAGPELRLSAITLGVLLAGGGLGFFLRRFPRASGS